MDDHACKTCSDTHRMPAPEDVGGEWPCTRCPTPCRSCACNGGRGAYCATTPCGCVCHVVRGAANLGNQEALLSRLRAAEERVRELEHDDEQTRAALAHHAALLVPLQAVAEAARARCRDAVPQWAPELRAALAALDAAKGGGA